MRSLGWGTSGSLEDRALFPGCIDLFVAAVRGAKTTFSQAAALWFFRTYFTTARGVEVIGSVWTFSDLTKLGRHEYWEDSAASPQTKPHEWRHRYDEYKDAPREKGP
jgi:predicted dithiol-disulfide oxidoreductase (DUF899 family)